MRDGHVSSVEDLALDVLRWSAIKVSLAGEHDFDGAMARVGQALSEFLQQAAGRPIAARVTLTGATPLYRVLLGQIERVREGIIAEGRQHGADAVWIELVALDIEAAVDLEGLTSRPDVIGRLARTLDELIDENGAGLLGDYPDRLRHRIPIELPVEHPLREGGPMLLKRARELVLARLAAED